MTHLAVSIFVDELAAAIAAARAAADAGADLVEYRIDRFTDDLAAVTALVEMSPLPCIITCRPAWEGGEYQGDDEDRLAVFAAAVAGVHQPAYLDVELAAWQRSPRWRERLLKIIHGDAAEALPIGLILSSHDFEQRPRDLYQKVRAMAEAEDGRVIKVAWQARSLRDNLEAFELLEQQYKPTIALCMGRFGLPSRVLAKKFGALLTFAALDAEDVTAPGQPTLEELTRLYRWGALRRSTQVFGVIGWPVGHSRSPAIHNAGFDATGYDGVYLPLPIPPEYEHFKATVGAWLDFAPVDFRGASVTIPHKHNLLRFVRERGGEIEPLAETIGAANTLTVRGDGSLYASNTDYAAALDAVCDGLHIERAELASQRVAVIGAGGAAQAIVAGFAHYGAQVTIYNRTLERAEALAARFAASAGQVAAAPLEALPQADYHVLINCTPVGMHPNVDASPLEQAAAWGPGLPGLPGVVVFDTIYNPAETRLLREAKAAGCQTISGVEMFVRQAAAQFELWTGLPAPLDAFRESC